VTSGNLPAGPRHRRAARRRARTGCRRPANLPHHGGHRPGCTGCRLLANRQNPPQRSSASHLRHYGNHRRGCTGCRRPANRQSPAVRPSASLRPARLPRHGNHRRGRTGHRHRASRPHRHGNHSRGPCCGRHRRSRQKNYQNPRSGLRSHRTTARCDAGDRHPIPKPAGRIRSGKMRQAHAQHRRIRGYPASWTRRRPVSQANTNQSGAGRCPTSGRYIRSRCTQSHRNRPDHHGHNRHRVHDERHPPTVLISLPRRPVPHRHGKARNRRAKNPGSQKRNPRSHGTRQRHHGTRLNPARPRGKPNHARHHRPPAAEDHQPRMGRRGPARCRHCHDCSRPLLFLLDA
jgi:hypothetical protein